MINIWFEKFSSDTFIKQIERTQALACGVRPRIYCNEMMRKMFGIGDKYNGSDLIIDDELDDNVFIIMSRRDKHGNVVLPYVIGNVCDDVFDNIFFAMNDYKWMGYPDNIIRKEKIKVIEKMFGVKFDVVDCGYCMCEELIRLDGKKCGTTSYPVEPIGGSASDRPVIWCKSEVDGKWAIINPEQDDDGRYCHFFVPDAQENKFVNVKYIYKQDTGDLFLMGKRVV